MKAADFIEATHTVESIEVTRVGRGELARFKIAAPQVDVAKCFRALPGEKMKAQPAPVSFRNALRFPEKGDKQKQNQVCIDLRLELEIARKIFRSDLAHSVFELKGSMQRVIEFLHEHNQTSDISIAQSRARIMLFELFNEPARIVNANVKLISRAAQKCARQLA